jgi:uncharacterized membrane protein
MSGADLFADVARSSRPDVRNPILSLPAALELLALPRAQRLIMKRLLRELKAQCREQERRAYSQRKGPLTAYWMAAGTYAGHVAAVLGK